MSVLEDHTFLGLVGLGTLVNPEVDSHIEALSDAGVRVVHFSDAPLREAKSYGAHIGLNVAEINTCVSLRDEPTRASSEKQHRRGLDYEYKRAQLPCGIAQIRNHLRFYDTIPLHVPMFCDCTGTTTRDVLSIMQDNHEVICALGSPRLANIRGLVQADVAVTVDADPRDDLALASDDLLNRVNEEPLARPTVNAKRCMQLVDALGNSVAALSGIDGRYALPVLTMIIREARISSKRVAATMEFAIQASVAVALLRSLTILFFFSKATQLEEQTYHQLYHHNQRAHALSHGATLFILYVTIPLLTVGIAISGAGASASSRQEVMQQMPSKHNFSQRILIFQGWFFWFVLRYLPTIVVLFAIYLWNGADCRAHEKTTTDISDCYENAQIISLLVATVLLSVHAVCHISTHHPLSLFPSPGRRSILQCRAILVCGLIATFVTLWIFSGDDDDGAADQHDSRLVGLNWFSWLVIIVIYVPIMLLVDAMVKRTRFSRMQQRQKYLKLVFSTRLGMHSPVGDLEDVAPEVAANRPSMDRLGSWMSMFFRMTSMDSGGEGEVECECCPRPSAE